MARVVLPDPEGPTMATRDPAGTSNQTSRSTGSPGVQPTVRPRAASWYGGPGSGRGAGGAGGGERRGTGRLGDGGGPGEHLRDPVGRRAEPRDFLRGRPEPGEDLVRRQRR